MKEPRASIKNLKTQVSQLVTSVSKLKSQRKLLSQTEVNLRPNVSVVTLRSDKELLENSSMATLVQGFRKGTEPEIVVDDKID